MNIFMQWLNDLVFVILGADIAILVWTIAEIIQRRKWRKTFVELRYGGTDENPEYFAFRLDILRYAGDLFHEGHDDQYVGVKIGEKFPEFYDEKFMYTFAYRSHRLTMRSDGTN